jgi:hypothetical protein
MFYWLLAPGVGASHFFSSLSRSFLTYNKCPLPRVQAVRWVPRYECLGLVCPIYYILSTRSLESGVQRPEAHPGSWTRCLLSFEDAPRDSWWLAPPRLCAAPLPATGGAWVGTPNVPSQKQRQTVDTATTPKPHQPSTAPCT